MFVPAHEICRPRSPCPVSTAQQLALCKWLASGGTEPIESFASGQKLTSTSSPHPSRASRPGRQGGGIQAYSATQTFAAVKVCVRDLSSGGPKAYTEERMGENTKTKVHARATVHKVTESSQASGKPTLLCSESGDPFLILLTDPGRQSYGLAKVNSGPESATDTLYPKRSSSPTSSGPARNWCTLQVYIWRGGRVGSPVTSSEAPLARIWMCRQEHQFLSFLSPAGLSFPAWRRPARGCQTFGQPAHAPAWALMLFPDR